jgi:uncharacterized protein
MSGFGKRGVSQPAAPEFKRASANQTASQRTALADTGSTSPRRAARNIMSASATTSSGLAQASAPIRATRSAHATSRDDGLRSYMLGVYNLMFLGVALSGAVAITLMSNPALLKALTKNPVFFLVIFFGTFGLSFFSGAIIQSRSAVLGHLFFWPYAILWGAGLAPMLSFLMDANAGVVIARAFFLAASLFGAASLYGYVTKNDLSGWGTMLCMLTWGLFAATVLNCFIFKFSLFGLILSYITVIIFTAVTAWETQMIKDMYNAEDGQGDSNAKSIFGAFQLYGSFMMIFSRLLQIMWSLYEEYA